MPPLTKVILCICTYKRPTMLRECLLSIASQEIPRNWEFEILIVNNAPDCDITQTIQYAKNHLNSRIHIVNEIQRGISFARNTACRTSLLLGADWILMMDDDETAKTGWLTAYANGICNFDADVFTGPVEYIFPESHRRWLENKGMSAKKTGSLARRASTNNVIFSTSILLPPLKMAFDNNMALTGGEDSDFFMRFTHAGGKIIIVAEAVVSEVVLENRLKISWRLYRQFWSSSSRVYTYKKIFGFRKTFLLSIKEIPMRIAHGIGRLIISPFLLPSNINSSKKSFYHGLRHFSKAAGTLTGLAGRHPKPYKKVDGH
jgi:succinoglycan biosynthesis protein ExoM